MSNKTVTYLVTEKDFRYHMKKCKMKAKGCIISSKTHPIAEVEKMKHSMLKAGKLRECDKGYILKEDYPTGLLMAYNLCSDKIESKLKSQHEVIINNAHNADRDIKDFFEIKNIASSENEFGNALKKDTYKLNKIERVEYNRKFYERAKNNDFSESEQSVVNSLKSVGAIKDYRRGIAERKEADIVVEEELRQIEIVNGFNVANNIMRFGEKSSSAVTILDAVDTGYYKLPEGVLKKFYTKEYSSKYTTELAILFTGTVNTATKLLNEIRDGLRENREIKNDFEKIHIVILDPISDAIIYVSGVKTFRIPIENVNVVLYKKTEIPFENMNDGEMYIMSCNNLFNKEKALWYLSGCKLKEIVFKMGIWRS